MTAHRMPQDRRKYPDGTILRLRPPKRRLRALVATATLWGVGALAPVALMAVIGGPWAAAATLLLIGGIGAGCGAGGEDTEMAARQRRRPDAGLTQPERATRCVWAVVWWEPGDALPNIQHFDHVQLGVDDEDTAYRMAQAWAADRRASGWSCVRLHGYLVTQRG